MKKILLIFLFLLLTNFNIYAAEDLTTFTEVDPSSAVTITSTKVSWASLESRDSVTYVYKDYGAGYFTDFTHKMTFSTQAGTNATFSGAMVFWGITNQVGHWGTWTDGIWLGHYIGSSASDNAIWLAESATLTKEVVSGLAANTPYYLTLDKTGNSITLTVYTDSARTNVFGSPVTLTGSFNSYRYLYALSAQDIDVPSKQMSAYVENLTFSDNTYIPRVLVTE